MFRIPVRFTAGSTSKLKKEVETGGLGGRLYADAIANLMAVYLFSNYIKVMQQEANFLISAQAFIY